LLESKCGITERLPQKPCQIEQALAGCTTLANHVNSRQLI
jgi:hypothetical protein